jgi:diaminohydroxyphosphoribosylaminopyrimidine deaminase / 5-amino-6-(5-phosphoribosylamino)uracil reductase
MRRALALAETARGRTSPNPLVGAVVLDAGGAPAGEGFHRRAGEPHAEVEALRAAGPRARGGTLYVSLEPCNHQGRTPPCTEAILRAGVARVVAARGDPNPRVAGGGAGRLRAAGVVVEVGVLAEEAARQNAGYDRLVAAGRPLVTLKLAASLDGRIATAGRQSRWITGEPSRTLVHEMRDAADAVAVGIGTALADDPLLTARAVPRPGTEARLAIPKPTLWRVVVDPMLRLPDGARLLAPDAGARTLVACARTAPADARARIEARGAAVVALPGLPAGSGSLGTPLDLSALLDDLGRREVAYLLVEGGAGLAGAFVDQRLVDRVAFFYAPLLIGGEGAPVMIGGAGAPTLGGALRLGRLRRRRVGEDLLVEADVVGR